MSSRTGRFAAEEGLVPRSFPQGPCSNTQLSLEETANGRASSMEARPRRVSRLPGSATPAAACRLQAFASRKPAAPGRIAPRELRKYPDLIPRIGPNRAGCSETDSPLFRQIASILLTTEPFPSLIRTLSGDEPLIFPKPPRLRPNPMGEPVGKLLFRRDEVVGRSCILSCLPSIPVCVIAVHRDRGSRFSL